MFEPTSSPAEPVQPTVPKAHAEPSMPPDVPDKGSRHKLCETNACLLITFVFLIHLMIGTDMACTKEIRSKF